MKTKKLILKILIFSLILLSAQTMWAENTSPEPYTENEFPQGLKDLRRFEIISLGSMPFVTFNTSLVYSGIRYARHDFNSAYAPNLFATSSYSAEEQREMILTSLGISIILIASYGFPKSKCGFVFSLLTSILRYSSRFPLPSTL